MAACSVAARAEACCCGSRIGGPAVAAHRKHHVQFLQEKARRRGSRSVGRAGRRIRSRQRRQRAGVDKLRSTPPLPAPVHARHAAATSRPSRPPAAPATIDARRQAAARLCGRLPAPLRPRPPRPSSLRPWPDEPVSRLERWLGRLRGDDGESLPGALGTLSRRSRRRTGAAAAPLQRRQTSPSHCPNPPKAAAAGSTACAAACAAPARGSPRSSPARRSTTRCTRNWKPRC